MKGPYSKPAKLLITIYWPVRNPALRVSNTKRRCDEFQPQSNVLQTQFEGHKIEHERGRNWVISTLQNTKLTLSITP